MQPQSFQVSFPWPDAMVLMEVIRVVVGIAYLLGVAAAVRFAIRKFAGPRGRTTTRWNTYFAMTMLTILVVLAAARGSLESLLGVVMEPLNRLAATTAPDWPRAAAVGVLRSVITTLALILIIQLIGWSYWRLEQRLQHWQESRAEQGVYRVLAGKMILRAFRVASIFTVILIAIPLYLSYFPRSRLLVEQANVFVAAPARKIAEAIVGYLPDLGNLILILILGRYTMHVIRYLFESLDKGTLTIKGFHPEWALPTYRLARTLFLLFILMVSYPYLPGSKSQFFQGFSVFVGALITFGSTGTIGNIVSGTVLTYTRAFRLGDMVTIGDMTGVVIEKNLLVTRLRTAKNEEVSIPNGNVLASSVLNYSARAVSEGVVLTVGAGIGYDVDWRTVHKLMIEGALATERIVKDPAPQVWQSELADYAVNYQLRAVTRETGSMWETLSLLRQNVLDAFNRAGVEIMTPSILAHRDASNLAVPLEQFPNRPEAGGIAVDLKPRA